MRRTRIEDYKDKKFVIVLENLDKATGIVRSDMLSSYRFWKADVKIIIDEEGIYIKVVGK